ncbi:DNA-dependent protein kinase catalytic subunit-like [Amphiura filiformis]|uniref:DNA-dependent protein kinase catalytic subunit-like n=1 Tax=Amphiura filiformis TaxID=82378 RepID=UPI003B211D3D
MSVGLKHGIYELLGVIAEVYPEVMLPYSEKLLKIYLTMLNQQMTSKTRKPELTVIAGCMLGLKHYLVNFTQSVEEGSKHTKDIYRFSRMSIDPTVKNVRYELNRVSLELFAKHAGQFNQLLYDDHKAQ